MKISVLSMLVLLSGCLLHAEEEKKPKHFEIASTFMKHIQEGSYSSAFTYASIYWPLPKQELDTLAYQTESQLTMLAGRFGKVTGTELVKTGTIGDSWINYTYLQKFQNHSLVWNIIFYKGGQEWKINAVMFNDQIYNLFE